MGMVHRLPCVVGVWSSSLISKYSGLSRIANTDRSNLKGPGQPQCNARFCLRFSVIFKMAASGPQRNKRTHCIVVDQDSLKFAL